MVVAVGIGELGFELRRHWHWGGAIVLRVWVLLVVQKLLLRIRACSRGVVQRRGSGRIVEVWLVLLC